MIEGWMGRGPRRWLRRMAKRHRRIVEVGVWKGRSTVELAATQGTVWAVDHWQGTPHDVAQHAAYPDAAAAHREFSENLRGHIAAGRVVVVQMDSTDAAAAIAGDGPFDFVFIDADHSYDGVRADIAAWTPLVAAGGVIGGHDYGGRWGGVARAVDEAFGDRVVAGPGSIWSVRL